MIVVKLGGSVFQSARKLVEGIVEHSDASRQTVMIVPGGGVFADTVRKVNAS